MSINAIKKSLKAHQTEKSAETALSEEMQKIADKYKGTRADGMDMIQNADAAFDEYKRKYEESAKIVDPGVIPIGANILLSTKLHSVEESGRFLVAQNFSMDAIRDLQHSINDIQEVIAVGPDAQQVLVGDIVKFNAGDFIRIKNPGGVQRQEVNELPIEFINDRPYLLMHERSLKFIYKREE